jgi:hypothetical protein
VAARSSYVIEMDFHLAYVSVEDWAGATVGVEVVGAAVTLSRFRPGWTFPRSDVRRYQRRYPLWVYAVVDTPVRWWYRLVYCRVRGHRVKFGSYGRCINCGKRDA